VIIALAALFLAAVPHAPANAALAGFYESRTMEVAGRLELRKDGHFRYELAYGALDEAAEGDWTFDGKSVHLTTRPMPKLPAFELVGDDPAPKGELWLTVDKDGFEWGGRLEAVAMDQSGEQGLVSTDESGKIDADGHVLTAVDPLVPVYSIPAGHFALSTDRGHRLRLKFHANDLGHAAFSGQPLELRGRDLMLQRYDTEIRFVRVRH
jgi:hypothetical protein